MKRIPKTLLVIIGLLAVLALALVGGCDTSEPSNGNEPSNGSEPTNGNEPEEVSTEFSVTDDRGITFDFDAPVDTLISLAPSNTEIVFFVDAGDKLIGRTEYCNYPAEASDVESIGGFWDPDKERVVVLDPDVVLATDMHVSTGDAEWLESQGLTVIVLDPEDMEGIMANIEMVGKLTGNGELAEEKTADLEARIDYVTERTAGLDEAEKPRVLHVTWHDPLWTVGSDNFLNTVISLAGGINIFTDVSGDVQVDIELAVTRDPQLITVVGSHGIDTNSYDYLVAADSPFAETEAYLNESIFMVDADVVSRPGPRIVDALELFAGYLHPEIFS
ncbi:MAG: helical backbone metal receptor [Dehalococcoidia bacterium]